MYRQKLVLAADDGTEKVVGVTYPVMFAIVHVDEGVVKVGCRM